MKTNTFNRFLALGLVLASQNTFGQLPAIDSLKLIPQNPTAADEIKVICYATFASGSCDMWDHLVIVQDNQITLNMEYSPGAATYICHAVDTVSLGHLNPGDYQLDANLVIIPMDAIKDHTTLPFSVGNSLGLGENTNQLDVMIHPNPFNSEIRIETNALIEKVELNSISGQKIHRSIPFGYDKKIDLSDIKDGIYLLTLTDNKGNRSTKRISKKTL